MNGTQHIGLAFAAIAGKSVTDSIVDKWNRLSSQCSPFLLGVLRFTSRSQPEIQFSRAIGEPKIMSIPEDTLSRDFGPRARARGNLQRL